LSQNQKALGCAPLSPTIVLDQGPEGPLSCRV